MRCGVILNIGVDPDYLRRRHEILTSAGFQVLNASSTEIALRIARQTTVSLAIFGHRIPAADRLTISAALRTANPYIRLVVMYDRSVKQTEAADAVLQVNVPPADLVHSVEYLLGSDGSTFPQLPR